MFKFNFDADDEAEPEIEADQNAMPTKEIKPEESNKTSSLDRETLLFGDDLAIEKHIKINNIPDDDEVEMISDSGSDSGESEGGSADEDAADDADDAANSDEEVAMIIAQAASEPKVYEGGFKLWECGVDLVYYLKEQAYDFTNKDVLEIGCGHGLPGIYALMKGATVDFQDYNEEVIVQLTIPNVHLNCPEPKSKFFSGDWSTFDQYLGDKKYDVILTSDTLYAIDSYKKLYNLIKNHLKDGGDAFIAAKKYYFGVGGSTHQFVAVVEKDKGNISTAKEIRDGVSNVREILKMVLPKQ